MAGCRIHIAHSLQTSEGYCVLRATAGLQTLFYGKTHSLCWCFSVATPTNTHTKPILK
jgi:hypothetical protein